LLILIDPFFLFIILEHAPLQLGNTTCYLTDPCVCVLCIILLAQHGS